MSGVRGEEHLGQRQERYAKLSLLKNGDRMPECPPKIAELVERFHLHLEQYKSGAYNETQVRREFIDPMFKALGWDVDNEQGNAEAYKDVIHEDAIRVGSAVKAPDYCFRIGGRRKFFLEAKKPSVYIKEEIPPAFQIRRYAWSSKLSLSILTDFEEFAVYDCRIKPDKDDKASTARVMYLRYTDYLDKWDEIAGIFSKDAILKGSFDRYAESTKKKKGTAEVDDAFLKEIEGWRDVLAKNIASRNENLSQRDLNYSVQTTIDRIIFLRICEDRGVEHYARLMAVTNGEGIYPRLLDLFYEADDKYNSGLFHFKTEKGRLEEPDELSTQLKIDDKILRDIILSLYYPDSPYEFSALPADILGQVYEQFLGKVIRLTPGHRAVVEDKPEVKKAGGVFYTPTYIVDYIVENTVGKLLEGKTPKQADSITICDPACGSGSFLIGAYQYLLDWRRDYYIENGPEKFKKELYQSQTGEWRLTIQERKRILLNSIYGVDIDSQAVETTKLSLLLKVLEQATEETINHNLRLFHERALPDLASNIKCGNSLIGPDFYNGHQLDLLDEEERYRINVFDWQAEFSEIMKSGGFDAVIGNPPYGFHQIHSEYIKPYLKKNFISSQGSFEHYFLFYERAINLLRQNGLHGFIVPVTWITIPSALSLRKWILEKCQIKELCWLPERVFVSANVNTLTSVIQKSPVSNNNVQVKIYDSLGFKDPPKEERTYKQTKFIKAEYFIGIFEGKSDSKIMDKISILSLPLIKFAKPCSGYNPYEVGKGEAPGGGLQTKKTVVDKPYHSDYQINKKWKPEIVGRNLGRYSLENTGKKWIKYGHWLAAPRDPNNFVGKRILVQEIAGGKERRIIATYYENELYYSRDIIPIKITEKFPSPFYILGIINSSLITWCHHKRNPKAQKGLFPKVLVSDLERIPIRVINIENQKEKSKHDKMVSLVETMFGLNKKLAEAKTDHGKKVLQRQIAATDRQIDNLVYELYNLTEEEIRIVEAADK